MKWLDFLGDYYKKQKKINGGYKYKDAMKDAAKLYKKKMSGGVIESDSESESDNDSDSDSDSEIPRATERQRELGRMDGVHGVRPTPAQLEGQHAVDARLRRETEVAGLRAAMELVGRYNIRPRVVVPDEEHARLPAAAQLAIRYNRRHNVVSDDEDDNPSPSKRQKRGGNSKKNRKRTGKRGKTSKKRRRTSKKR
jgi:hypothetical protein